MMLACLVPGLRKGVEVIKILVCSVTAFFVLSMFYFIRVSREIRKMDSIMTHYRA